MKKIFNFKAGNDNGEVTDVVVEETTKRTGLGKWVIAGVAAVAAVAIGAIALVKKDDEEELYQPEDGEVIEVTDEDIESIVE